MLATGVKSRARRESLSMLPAQRPELDMPTHVRMECPCGNWDLEIPISADTNMLESALLAHRGECIVYASAACAAMAS